MTEQRLRISEQGAEAARAPRLELAGLWLEDAGFPVGVEVEVEVVEPGRLVVSRVVEDGCESQGLLPLVWIPAERVAAVERAAARAAGRACA